MATFVHDREKIIGNYNTLDEALEKAIEVYVRLNKFGFFNKNKKIETDNIKYKTPEGLEYFRPGSELEYSPLELNPKKGHTIESRLEELVGNISIITIWGERSYIEVIGNTTFENEFDEKEKIETILEIKRYNNYWEFVAKTNGIFGFFARKILKSKRVRLTLHQKIEAYEETLIQLEKLYKELSNV